jgi:type IV pilus assembly protein PilA
MKKSTKGFSLIELLIVVAIILIIAAIAVPNLLRSRIAANQASAAQSLRTINTSEVAYASTYGTGYSAKLANLGPAAGVATAAAAGLVDSLLGVDPAVKSGYTMTYTAGAADAAGNINTYGILAVPSTPGTTGTNAYCTDQTFVIHFNTGGAACNMAPGTDPPIGN